jgi:uncharacterized protein DUF11
MTTKSLFRRLGALAGLALLTSATSVIIATPAQAAVPEVELSSSVSTVSPNGNVTVTEKVTNVNPFTVLQPKAQLFSVPTVLASYTSFVGCTGGTCSTINGVNGPIGYQVALPEALGANEDATVTITFKVSAATPDLTETLRGQFFGSNYGSEPVDGPSLTVDANADGAVSVAVTPHPGLLGGRFDFAVRVANPAGPGQLRNYKVTTTLPAGLSGTGNSACVPSAGKVVCTVNGVAIGQTATANFSVPFGLLTIGLPFTFTSTRTSSDSRDLNAANNSASVTCNVVTPLLINCS